jgi:DNA-binding HxlR family transcriptional regulator
MKVTDHSANRCAAEVTLSVIGGKWKPLILWDLSERGVRRFLELQ